MIEVISPNDTVTISRAEYDELKRADMKLSLLRDAIDANTDFSQYYDHKMNLKNDDRFYFTIKIVDPELYSAIKARLDSEQDKKESISSIREEEVE